MQVRQKPPYCILEESRGIFVQMYSALFCNLRGFAIKQSVAITLQNLISMTGNVQEIEVYLDLYKVHDLEYKDKYMGVMHKGVYLRCFSLR